MHWENISVLEKTTLALETQIKSVTTAEII